MERATIGLPLPDEPTDLKTETRTLLEESPEEGSRVVAHAGLLSESLWEAWGANLEEAGMDYDRFVEISRGYAGEARLWVVGERPWDHFAAGLAGRVLRRLPDQKATILAEVKL